MTSGTGGVAPTKPSWAAMSLGALGIVFGDIGTSPLYTLKTVLGYTGPHPDVGATLGALSLILWTLIIVTTVKYVGVAMRIGNEGEGGIIALMTLLGVKKRHRPAIIAAGLEGLEQVTPTLTPYVLPAAVVILLALFAVQPFGTASIGRLFGPIMVFWFIVMAAMGVYGVSQHPTIIVAVNPWYGLKYLFSGGFTGFLVLGGVFLCVTGAEALYADMGHFGPGPIRLSWNFVVFPSLILNYMGQAAIVVEGAPTDGNIFYHLCPAPLLTPLIVLSTVATVIASQSIITGAYSMTRQAIQLGWLPRLIIKQTSAEGYGQIYVGAVNWLLMIVTIGLTVGFGKSDNLAAAYGIAVSLTMLITSVLLFIAMREIWGWNILAAGSVAGVFLLVDTGFFVANMAKVFDGGYVPLLLAGAVYGLMWVWHRGVVAVHAAVTADQVPTARFLEHLKEEGVARVRGSAVFLTRSKGETPPVLSWHVRKNRSLHERVVALTLTVVSTPRTDQLKGIRVSLEGENYWRVEAQYGFMDTPDVPAILREASVRGAEIDCDDLTYYVGHETIISRDDGQGIPRWQEMIFALMGRNAARISDYLKLPWNQVVEIGREIEI
jgi:KUP system potassium uptake protein